MHRLSEPPLNPEYGIAIFTDGSAYTKDRTGGWAWVAIDAFDGVNYESGFCAQVTNNQMELYAVARALEAIGYDYPESDVLVYSDSEYVVLGFNDKSRKRNKNHDYWKAMEQYVGFSSSVTMEHVKGHSDSEYNNMADKLAGEARRNGDIHGNEEAEGPEAIEES